jgi:hypothetical protein
MQAAASRDFADCDAAGQDRGAADGDGSGLGVGPAESAG